MEASKGLIGEPESREYPNGFQALVDALKRHLPKEKDKKQK